MDHVRSVASASIQPPSFHPRELAFLQIVNCPLLIQIKLLGRSRIKAQRKSSPMQASGTTPVDTIASAQNLHVARAAFGEYVLQYPNRRMTLQIAAHVIDEHLPSAL
jgi:hypothetical protein